MDPRAFAMEWEAVWDTHDLPRLLGCGAEDMLARSAKARARPPGLAFTDQNTFEGHGMAVIVYANHRYALAAEPLWFDPDGRDVAASACHGRVA